jgi:GNAT superfamily N-acetyltransferase
MRIEMTTALTAQQKREEAALLAKVHAHDHTFKDIYLSNQLNTEKGMGTFFLAYRDAQLVGFLMNYADGPATEAAELSVIVDPDHRRQGIATALIAAVRAELAKFGYDRYEFVSERTFSPERTSRLRTAPSFSLVAPGRLILILSSRMPTRCAS